MSLKTNALISRNLGKIERIKLQMDRAVLRKLGRDDFKTMPWKNGKGVTTELHRIDTDAEMAFRVSSARVAQSGAFSDFSGYERTLVNLGPGEMRLSIDGEDERTLRTLETLHFDGGRAAHCAVSSPCEDLNIFCRHGAFFASTSVRTLAKPEFIPLLPGSGWLIFVVSGELCAHGPDRKELIVGSREALLQDIGTVIEQARVMLASSSEEVCVIAAISYRMK